MAADGKRMVARAGQVLLHPDGMGNKILEPATLLAENFPRAIVCATDSSEAMVDKAQARARSKGLQNMICEVMDMQDVDCYLPATFDVVTC